VAYFSFLRCNRDGLCERIATARTARDTSQRNSESQVMRLFATYPLLRLRFTFSNGDFHDGGVEGGKHLKATAAARDNKTACVAGRNT